MPRNKNNVIFRKKQCPGDEIVMSAAIRDLHRRYPNQYRVGVDTHHNSLFSYHPDIDLSLIHGTTVPLGYGLTLKKALRTQVHFLWGFVDDINKKLNLDIKLTEFRPSLYLSEKEKEKPPLGIEKPYWVFVGGGKPDYSAKWWYAEGWTKVVEEITKYVLWFK